MSSNDFPVNRNKCAVIATVKNNPYMREEIIKTIHRYLIGTRWYNYTECAGCFQKNYFSVNK